MHTFFCYCTQYQVIIIDFFIVFRKTCLIVCGHIYLFLTTVIIPLLMTVYLVFFVYQPTDTALPSFFVALGLVHAFRMVCQFVSFTDLFIYASWFLIFQEQSLTKLNFFFSDLEQKQWRFGCICRFQYNEAFFSDWNAFARCFRKFFIWDSDFDTGHMYRSCLQILRQPLAGYSSDHNVLVR